MAKYRNKKCEYMGMTFDSKAELARYQELALLAKAGRITDLRRQVPLPLVPGCKLHGDTRKRPAIRLVIDFVYNVNGIEVYEDTKGMETPLSKTKRHMAKSLHGIDVQITGK